MPTAVPAASRRLLLPSLVLIMSAAALALPAGARAADDQSCYGGVKPIKPDAERDTGATYEFSCASSITGFVLTSTSAIASFDVTADVFDSPAAGSGLRGDDRFGECGGDIPSYGFHCTGTYTGGQGRFVRATFDGASLPCARDATRHITTRVSLVVTNASGKIAGPFELGKPKGCPKAKRARAKHKKRTPRSHSKS